MGLLSFKYSELTKSRSNNNREELFSDEDTSIDIDVARACNETVENSSVNQSLNANEEPIGSNAGIFSARNSLRQPDVPPPRFGGHDSSVSSSTTVVGSGSRQPMTNLASFDESHVFSWFAAVPTTSRVQKRQALDQVNSAENNVARSSKARKAFLIDGAKIEGMLTDMHSFLCSSRCRKHREYRRCLSDSVEEVNAVCQRAIREYQGAMSKAKSEKERKTKRSKGSKRDGSHSGQDNQTKGGIAGNSGLDGALGTPSAMMGRSLEQIQLIKLSKSLFQLFLPLDFSSDMVLKYWGAIKLILQVQ